jgi:hypothetical protein
VRSALHASEEALSWRVTSRLTEDSRQRIAVLLAVTDDDAIGAADVDGGGGRAVLGMIKEAPGSVSLDTMLSEIDKLLAVRAIGVGGAVFADIAPNVIAGWRVRAAVEQIADIFNVPRTTVYGHLEQSSTGKRPAVQRATVGA